MAYQFPIGKKFGYHGNSVQKPVESVRSLDSNGGANLNPSSHQLSNSKLRFGDSLSVYPSQILPPPVSEKINRSGSLFAKSESRNLALHTPNQYYFPGKSDYKCISLEIKASDTSKLRQCYSNPNVRNLSNFSGKNEITIPPIMKKLNKIQGTLNLLPIRADPTTSSTCDSSDEDDDINGLPRSLFENSSFEYLEPPLSPKPEIELLDNYNGNKPMKRVEINPISDNLIKKPNTSLSKQSGSCGDGLNIVNRERAPLQHIPASAEHPNEPSTIKINNKTYMVLKELGKGGSSIVYQVYDSLEKQLLAVKCINLSSGEPLAMESYKNEIAQLKCLQGKDRVIKLYDFEYKKSEEKLLVLMENGDADLAKILHSIEQHERQNPVIIKFYWSEMLKAVSEIHEMGIIHFDLKPANFLLVSGKLKLIDFGISSAMEGDTTSVIKDTLVGTANFMSPEAIQDTSQECVGTSRGQSKPQLKISPKSDVWSLGCILYSLVYARSPFQNYSNILAKVKAIVNPMCKIDFPEKDIDPLLIDVLKATLRRSPKERPSIAELLIHPYLQESAPKVKGVNQVIEGLQTLTPRSIERVSRMVQELQLSKNK